VTGVQTCALPILNDCELHKEDCIPRSNLISYLSSSILSRDFKINVYGRTVLPASYMNVKPVYTLKKSINESAMIQIAPITVTVRSKT
jgi:hypothetical protein